MASTIKRGAAWLALPLLLALAGCPPPVHDDDDGDDDSAGDDDTEGDDDAADDDAGDDDTTGDYGPRSCNGSAPTHPDLMRS